MDITTMQNEFSGIGVEMHRLIENLYPLCRSITGQGIRETLARLLPLIPLEIRQIPSGSQVFDWSVPKEWNIRDAWVKDPYGNKVIDFTQSNLHVLNYSVPIQRKMPLAELREHLFSLPDQPDWIPYRTSYYKENWGFCLRHNDLLKLEDGEYEVSIDSSLEPGVLAYGELYLPGKVKDEILISTHSCHPSLCNDNLSGVALSTFLARWLSQQEHYYSYRFVFVPGTIGAITWLAQNEAQVNRIRHGLVVACVGDPGNPHYKRSRNGNGLIDRAVQLVLRDAGQPFTVEDFSPYGYDERQYSSPGFNLEMGCLSRTPHGRFPQYHTSADNLDFVRPEALEDSLRLYAQTLFVLEKNAFYLNLNPKCEPQLGRRGLYSAFGGKRDSNQYELAMLWVLNYSDGQHDLIDIAEKSKFSFPVLYGAVEALSAAGLLQRKEDA
jgi:aminopeptidase-like protein